MITLYHGSNVEIETIDFTKCKPGKDFGKGFYLNPNYEQARGMAIRTTRTLGVGKVIVNEFQFDDSILNSDKLKVKIFPDYCSEWADFIVKNRKNRSSEPIHDYDIVIGPIADDSVGVQIRRFIQGYISVDNLVEELRFIGSHAIQYFFANENAIQYLKRI
ncbi:MAG: DUF3990 domain-containing protein [Muribaculaceae bacterium]|nr:DUF3990 domain-containing protein [Muribaculaceae bacterium]